MPNDMMTSLILRALQGANPGIPLNAAANPNDPNQQSNWAMGTQNSLANQGIFGTPEQMAQIQALLAPYFKNQMQNLDFSQGSALNDASRSSSAYAASRGIDNPSALLNQARLGVYSSFAPQYGALQENQLGTILNSAMQNQRFKYDNAQNMSNLWNQRFMMNEQMKNQPNFWENLGSGILTGGLGLLGGFLNSPSTPSGGTGGMTMPSNWTGNIPTQGQYTGWQTFGGHP